MHFHAVVWIDHRNAHVLGFGEGEPSRNLIRNRGPERIHHKAGSVGSGHIHDAPAYFAAIAEALAGFHEIVVLGPAETKVEFVAYLDRHHPSVSKKIMGVEAMDHASEGEIIDRARRFFIPVDRTTPQRS